MEMLIVCVGSTLAGVTLSVHCGALTFRTTDPDVPFALATLIVFGPICVAALGEATEKVAVLFFTPKANVGPL
jgi:hypothetical protein